jgi:hypothetical protein
MTEPTQETTATEAQDPNADIEQMTQGELLAERDKLIKECDGDPRSLADEQLHRVCAIHRRLRQVSSGPPKKKVAAAKKAAPKPTISLDDIPDF